ncbi:MAG: hypothetical protein K2N25_01825, partial [Muribaculaceae bacterium]|nr:hypothetical protein [Muribaculaceae bacterium]
KLKCCLNFEIDAYAAASKQLPKKDVVLQTKDSDYYLFKTDILTRTLTYSTDRKMGANLTAIPASRAFEIIALNKQGVRPDRLSEDTGETEARREYIDLTDQDALTRFDKAKKKKSKHKGNQGGLPQKGNLKKEAPEQPRQTQQQENGAKNPENGSKKTGQQRKQKRQQRNKDQKKSNTNTESHDLKNSQG